MPLIKPDAKKMGKEAIALQTRVDALSKTLNDLPMKTEHREAISQELSKILGVAQVLQPALIPMDLEIAITPPRDFNPDDHFDVKNPQHVSAIENAFKELKKSVDELEKKIHAEAKFYETELKKIGSSKNPHVYLKEKLEEQMRLNVEFLKTNPTNDVIIYANEKLTLIANALTRAGNIQELPILTKMALRVIADARDEIREVNAGKVVDGTRLDALKNCLEDRHGLESTIDKDTLNIRKDTDLPNGGNYLVFDPNSGHFVDRTIKDEPQFENMEMLNKDENYERLKTAVRLVEARLKWHFNLANKTEQQMNEWKVEIDRARILLERLRLYKEFLDSQAPGIRERRLEEVKKIKDGLKACKKEYGKTEAEQKVGHLSDYAHILDKPDDQTLADAVVAYHTGREGTDRDTQVVRDAQRRTGSVRTDVENLKSSDNFNPKTQARILHTAVQNSDKSFSTYTTDQMVIGGAFFSRFNYTYDHIAALPKEEQFILAIKEANNFMMALKDHSARTVLSGDYPKYFIQTMVDYMEMNGHKVVNNATDSKAWVNKSKLESSWNSRRNTQNDLEKHKERIFGKSDSLAMSQSSQQKVEKDMQITSTDVSKYRSR